MTGLATHDRAPLAGHVEAAAGGARQTGLVRQLARVGLCARAVVYLLVGALVLEIAVRGRPSSQADSQGAFEAIDHRTGGPVLLVILGIGLAGYAAWRAVQAVGRGRSRRPVSTLTRLGRAAIAIVYASLCVQVFKLVAGSRPTGGASQHPSSVAATVLGWPGGPLLLGFFGAGLAIGGLSLGVWGLVHDHARDLETPGMHPATRTAARVTGAVGNAGRAVAVLLVGVSLVSSAVADDALHAKSLDAALQALVGDAGGPELLGAIAVCFLAFSFFSVLEALDREP